MSDNRLTRNSFMAIVQILISGGVLFLLYRYLLRTIGPDQVGIWSIVLATASASRISEMGFSGSALKFTAQYIARGEKNKATAVIQTTVITIGGVLACILAASFPVIAWLMGKVIGSAHISSGLAILPYALVSVWIVAVAGVFLSGLEGCQRIDLRALVHILASLLFLGLTWILVPRYGLIGLACAQIGQGMLMLIVSWGLLRRKLPSLTLKTFRWRYSLFREMLHYGFNFQVISIFGMFFEPTTKMLMAKFGGLTSTAYYEMANRMVMQFRSLLISANQVIVPQIAEFHENAPEKIQKAYLDSYRVILFMALPLYVSVAGLAPLASELWIGHYEPKFVGYTLLLVTGLALNTLVGPAYFVNLGTGRLRWNTLSHVAIGILNLAFGYLLGLAFGGGGVVTGYVLALVTGSSIIILGYHRDYRIPLADLFLSENKKLFLACFLGLVIGLGIFVFLGDFMGALARAVLVFTICVIPVGIAFWIHPLRTKISLRIAASFGSHAR